MNFIIKQKKSKIYFKHQVSNVNQIKRDVNKVYKKVVGYSRNDFIGEMAFIYEVLDPIKQSDAINDLIQHNFNMDFWMTREKKLDKALEMGGEECVYEIDRIIIASLIE